jgi:hypothetical protein
MMPSILAKLKSTNALPVFPRKFVTSNLSVRALPIRLSMLPA